jgi:hypothetical protein
MTQQYSQKYTVVCFFDPQEKSHNFAATDWPLHITILDTFKTEWEIATLCKALEDVATETLPFDATPTEKALLGENKDVPVKLLQIKGPLSTLHNKLMKLADTGSFVFNTPAFVGSGFLPHATDQSNGQVEIGKPYQLRSISLIDMFPAKNHMRRVVVESFNFKN